MPVELARALPASSSPRTSARAGEDRWRGGRRMRLRERVHLGGGTLEGGGFPYSPAAGQVRWSTHAGAGRPIRFRAKGASTSPSIGRAAGSVPKRIGRREKVEVSCARVDDR